jgi:hypothetical protein
MSDNATSIIELVIKAAVPIIAVIVGWVLKVLWGHHEDIATLKTGAYTKVEAKVDRTAMLDEFRELRHDIKEDFQRLENKLDDMRDGN